MKPGAAGFAIAASLAFGAVTPAAAIPITFSFTGTVSDVPVDEEGLGIGFGSEITGSYTFDPAAADLIAGGSSASYQMAGAPFGLSVDVGGHAFDTSDALAVNLFDSSVDQYGVLACSDDLGCSGELAIELFFQDPTGTALGDDLLPLVPPDLTGFAAADFHLIALLNGNQVQIDGSIDSLVCTAGCAAVPEPGTLVLLGAGAGALGFLRRHRRARLRARR